MAEFFGFTTPFIGGGQGILSRQEDLKLIQNDILLLLFTIPGERVYRSDFGVNLRNVVFEPDDPMTLDNLRNEIITQLTTHEPRITLSKVEIVSDTVKNGITITILGSLKKDPTKLINIEQFVETD